MRPYVGSHDRLGRGDPRRRRAGACGGRRREGSDPRRGCGADRAGAFCRTPLAWWPGRPQGGTVPKPDDRPDKPDHPGKPPKPPKPPAPGPNPPPVPPGPRPVA
jgi:hypothetical protein